MHHATAKTSAVRSTAPTTLTAAIWPVLKLVCWVGTGDHCVGVEGEAEEVSFSSESAYRSLNVGDEPLPAVGISSARASTVPDE